MSGPDPSILRHARQRPGRSPGVFGRVSAERSAPGPSALTICGAEATTNDLGNRDARCKGGAEWITCSACWALIRDEPPTESGVRS